MRELPRLGVRVFPSQADFVFVDVDGPSGPVYQVLLRKGVIVRSIGGLQHFHVSVGLPEDNARFVSSLGEVLRGE